MIRRKPLDAAGQELVLQHWRYAAGIAHSIWRRCGLPAVCWEEMRGEALLELVDMAAGYTTRDDAPFHKIFSQRIRWAVYRWLRKWRNRPEEGADWLDEVEEQQEESLEEEKLYLLRCVEKLPAPQRDAIRVRFGLDGTGELPLRTAAAVLNISTATVTKRELHGIANLRKMCRGGLGIEVPDDDRLKRILAAESRAGGRRERAAKNLQEGQR